MHLKELKKKTPADKAQAADSNRAKFGRTKAQKLADQQEERRKAALLDGARLERKEEFDGDV